MDKLVGAYPLADSLTDTHETTAGRDRVMKKIVAQHIEKARSSAICAVENYNRPNGGFRTRTFIVLIVMAWTALFHAVFYARGVKPWYVAAGRGNGRRYAKVDGEPKHWELSECIRQFWNDAPSPERSNLEFLIKLRNKIEHRDHPELDPALYGECQAALLNFEDFLTSRFGPRFALTPTLSVALQFSSLRPEYQNEALRRLQASTAQDLLSFIQAYRAGLAPEILESNKYSLRVFLVPKLANRESAADLAVEFVRYDPTGPTEMKELEQLAALIKDRRVPVVGEGLMKPGDVVKQVQARLPFPFNMDTHTRACKRYKVRPPGGSTTPEATRHQYCVYDSLSGSYPECESLVLVGIGKLLDKVIHQGWRVPFNIRPTGHQSVGGPNRPRI